MCNMIDICNMSVERGEGKKSESKSKFLSRRGKATATETS